MNLLVLYLVLCKAMLSSFSGPTSLPVVREDLVAHYHVLTDNQLEAAVASGRATPGPFGLYMVSVGYFIAGVPGASVGFLALITPAFLIIPMLRYLSKSAGRPAVQSAIHTVTLAAAGLLISTDVPFARDSLNGVVTLAIGIGVFFVLILTKLPTFWAIFAAAICGVAGSRLL